MCNGRAEVQPYGLCSSLWSCCVQGNAKQTFSPEILAPHAGSQIQPLSSWNVLSNHRAQREHYAGSSTQGESIYTTQVAVYMCG